VGGSGGVDEGYERMLELECDVPCFYIGASCLPKIHRGLLRREREKEKKRKYGTRTPQYQKNLTTKLPLYLPSQQQLQ
jgi:hypothetical protein